MINIIQWNDLDRRISDELDMERVFYLADHECHVRERRE
jgi:hypothetical protein